MPDESQNTTPSQPKPPKLGGWLIIVMISLNLSLIRLTGEIVWQAKLLSVRLIPLAHTMTIYNLAVNGLVFTAVIYLLVLMYMKKKLFIASVVAFLIFIILENTLSYFLFKSLSDEISDYLTQNMILALMAGVPLIGYFTNSDRVRATFIL